MITTIQNYVQTQIQGLQGAYGGAGLEAWVDPPVGGIASLETPQAYVLATSGDGKRQTMAGLAGFYQQLHHVYVQVGWAMLANTPDGNLAFTNLLDTIIATIRANYTGAIFIPDPVTGQETQLLVIGDTLNYKYIPQMNLGEDGSSWIVYSAQIDFTVEEKIQQNT